VKKVIAKFKNESERQWMLKMIPEMENFKDNKMNLLKFLVSESKKELKLKTRYDFSSLMESISAGHPSMSSQLKSTLHKITARDCELNF
jgi:hypothetical protein